MSGPRFHHQAATPLSPAEVDALRAEAAHRHATSFSVARVRRLLASYYRLQARYRAREIHAETCECCRPHWPTDDEPRPHRGRASGSAGSPAEEGQRR